MALYMYQAKDRSGQTVSGQVEAHNQREAVLRVQEMGYWPTRLRPSSGPEPAVAVRSSGRGLLDLLTPRPSARSLALFYRQFASMLSAGLGMAGALHSLQASSRGRKLRRALPDLLAAVESGEPCSRGMEKHPEVFPPLHLALFRAGERTGRLEVACSRIADQIEHRYRLWLKLLPSLVYPLGLVVVSALVAPVVYSILGQGNLLDLLAAGTRPLWELALGLYLFYLALKWEPLALVADAVKLALPVVAGIVRKQSISRFFRAFADLQDAGLPVGDSLTVSADACGNRVIARSLRRLRPYLMEGAPLTDTLARSGMFPRGMLEIVRSGEVSGQVDASMRKAAEYLDAESEAAMGVVMALMPVAFWAIGAFFMIRAIFGLLGAYQGQLDRYMQME